MKRLSNRRGQSIMEYLIIIAVVVAGVIAMRAAVQTGVVSVGTEAGARLTNAAGPTGLQQIGINVDAYTAVP